MNSCVNTNPSILELIEKIDSLNNEIELLSMCWNAAYDLGVRVEIDGVTGEICRTWIERKNR